MTQTITGLTCPRCGGMVPIPEGQSIVVCPYCDLRSAVAADAALPAFTGAQAGAKALGPAADGDRAGTRLGEAISAPQEINASFFEGFGGVQTAQPVGAADPSGSVNPPGSTDPTGSTDPPGSASPKGAGAVRPAGAADPAIHERRGVLRYQAPLRTERDQAVQALRGFLSGKFQVARDAAKEAKLSEVFLVHLPFWAVWGRGVAYAFGQQRVGSGDNARYEPREKKVVRELSWNSPACEVGEFGVQRIGLEGCPLEPFNPDALHRSGMVFEPVGSARAALEAARAQFDEEIREHAELSRVNQRFTRLIRPRLGLVYYPLWVLRYHYHGRAFQVAVDGVNGQVLYGKAPGSVAYRAGVLVGGMALGSVLAVDVPALVMIASGRSSDSEDSPFLFALAAFAAGLGILWWAYRTFRHAEHYEYHRYKGKAGKSTLTSMLPAELSEATKMIDKFS